jgi:TMEM175 potassium channel family protein
MFYNQIAGRNLARLSALSDDVFAVGMTLLVLDLHVPAAQNIKSEHDLILALGALLPHLVPYLLSFMTLGIFWVGQQTQLSHFTESDRNFTWIQVAFLSLVTLMPLSTSLLAEFITYRTALLVYWLNILLLGSTLYAGWRYACKAGLVASDDFERLTKAVEGRILVSQALYALGAFLCIFNTAYSIAFIVALQLYYVLAPRENAPFQLLRRRQSRLPQKNH